MKNLPVNTVRGRIRTWIEKHANKLGLDVLEVGSRMHVPGAWWINNRDLKHPDGNWTGLDFEAGDNVDIVGDVHKLKLCLNQKYSGILCSEILEHVARPWIALKSMRSAIQPGGYIIITTLQCFPLHGFPDDFYRFSESGLRILLEDAGFIDIELASAGEVIFKLDDHGSGIATRVTPMHVFAVARVPS